MSEGRIERLPIADAKEAAGAAGVPDYMADLSVFRVLLRRPGLARAVHDLLSALLWDARLDARLRELVIMRIGWVTGSTYEWTQHWRVATGLGVTERDLLAVRDWQGHDRFGPVERAVLAATDETLASGAVSEATWDACVEQLGGDDAVLVELAASIGTWSMISSMLRTLDVPLEDGVEPWPPDGARPASADQEARP
jgi:alkylhydroperoxidase family enzyme